MKEHPIIFSAPMVKAILAGTKTQTRRIAKLCDRARTALTDAEPPVEEAPGMFRWPTDPRVPGRRVDAWNAFSPYGEPGDRLWVRETHTYLGPDYRPTKMKDRGRVLVSYRADHSVDPDHGDGPDELTWRPSIFMPRWASRITLEVTEARVERLQSITEEDAKAEGMTGDCGVGNLREYMKGRCQYHFAALWDEINGKRAPWQSNPWVWVVSFRKVTT